MKKVDLIWIISLSFLSQLLFSQSLNLEETRWLKENREQVFSVINLNPFEIDNFNFYTSKQGVLYQIIKIIEEDLQLNIHQDTSVDNSNLRNLLESTNPDILFSLENDSINNSEYYKSSCIYSSPWVLYSKSQTDIMFLGDLHTKKIGILSHTSLPNYFLASFPNMKIDFLPFQNIEMLFKKLNSNELDAIIAPGDFDTKLWNYSFPEIAPKFSLPEIEVRKAFYISKNQKILFDIINKKIENIIHNQLKEIISKETMNLGYLHMGITEAEKFYIESKKNIVFGVNSIFILQKEKYTIPERNFTSHFLYTVGDFLNLSVTLYPDEESSLISKLEKNELDAVIFCSMHQEDNNFLYTRPLFFEQFHFYGLEDAESLTDFDPIVGKRLAFVENREILYRLRNSQHGIIPSAVENLDQAIRLLVNNEADYLLATPSQLNCITDIDKLSFLQDKGTSSFTTEYSFALSKENKELFSILQKSIDYFSFNQEYASLPQTIQALSPKKPLITNIFFTLGGIIASSILLVIIISFSRRHQGKILENYLLSSVPSIYKDSTTDFFDHYYFKNIILPKLDSIAMPQTFTVLTLQNHYKICANYGSDSLELITQNVSYLIKQSFPEKSIFVRYNTDKILIITPGTNLDQNNKFLDSFNTTLESFKVKLHYDTLIQPEIISVADERSSQTEQVKKIIENINKKIYEIAEYKM